MALPEAKTVVEVLAILMSALGICGLLYHRLKSQRSIGARAIQFAAVVLLIPAILILSLENKLDPQSLGTLIGAIAGILLSGLANSGQVSSSEKRVEKPD